jgi:hypothetical protein
MTDHELDPQLLAQLQDEEDNTPPEQRHYNEPADSKRWAEQYPARLAQVQRESLLRDLADLRRDCKPWCAGPTELELGLSGSHRCPPEPTEGQVDELQLSELAARLRDVRLIVGPECVIHGEVGTYAEDCPWCRLVELVKDVQP